MQAYEVAATQLARAVVNTMAEQDRVIALENCFHTWDGNVDLEVIEQGIMERYAAMGRNEPLGIRFERDGLNMVKGYLANMETGEVTHIFTTYSSVSPWFRDEKFFTHKERHMVSEWLGKNFYHH